MNSSQLLYKISDLQYSIRMKEAEYNKAVKANDQANMQAGGEAVKLLKEELEKTVKAFDSIPPYSPEENSKVTKKPRKWHSFFTLKTAANRK